MAMSLAERAEQLNAEQRLLEKADQGIDDGWRRIRDQEDRVRELMAGGQDTRQAQRLVDLLKQTLIEWEHHRVLIEQRVNYLRQDVETRSPEAG
ncbi:hypothetical protein [Bradyrhizobium guangxiense]|uniref:hypothetical protein n=1 Tax=Bradyrhizobium guangxiense TaxID=1325115 RepID=UPI001008BDAF|nr:hypothetical protein [Bradyrhizobium guangxiense]